MRLANLLGRTLRDTPAEAEQIGHQLVLRAGLARALAPGSFALLPLGMAVVRRIEAIMHEELAALAAQELRTPVVQPAALWEQSGRYAEYGSEMLKLVDRAERILVVAPTHEEAMAELARREIASYRQLPALVYQINTKCRDEIRTKGGLMRMREFTMLDAYSFDADSAGLDASYSQMDAAVRRIFERCGVRYIAVEAASGQMGGHESREYMAVSPSGEDSLAHCANCGYAANLEVAERARPVAQGGEQNALPPSEEVATPGTATIADLAAFLGVPAAATAKAVFFDTPEHGLLFAVIRGDLEVSEAKLAAAAGVRELRPATATQISASGAVAGYASPVAISGAYVVADHSVVAADGLVAGANKTGYHLRNVVYGRDWSANLVADIAAVQAGDPCARCGAPLALEKCVEIGHIFKLGTRYADGVGASYLDDQGVVQPVVMGSYGIGVERLIQIVVEQHHDERGIVWPAALAPADAQIIALGKGTATKVEAARIAAALTAAGLRVILDDRDDTAGVKFNDADLIGLPVRIVVGEKGLAAGEVELKARGAATAVKAPRDEVIAVTQQLLADARNPAMW